MTNLGFSDIIVGMKKKKIIYCNFGWMGKNGIWQEKYLKLNSGGLFENGVVNSCKL